MTPHSNPPATDNDASNADHQLAVEDAFVFRTTKERLEGVLSDPDRIAAAIPGVSELTEADNGTYTCSITQSLSGITHLTLSMEAEFEVHRPDGPATVVIRGTAEDAGTGSKLAGVAAIRIEETGEDIVELSYVADISMRTDNAILSPDLLEPTLTDTIQRGAENLGSALSDSGNGGD